MPAIGRALLLNPRPLLLDEALDGLAAVIVRMLPGANRRIVQEAGMAAIPVEQHASQVLPVTDRAVVAERGRAAAEAAFDSLLRDTALLGRHLGPAAHRARPSRLEPARAALHAVASRRGGLSAPCDSRRGSAPAILRLRKLRRSVSQG